jgi:hypothetical protein
MVLGCNLPKFLWIEIVNVANYLVNRSPTRTNFNISHEKKIMVRYLTCPFFVFIVVSNM